MGICSEDSDTSSVLQPSLLPVHSKQGGDSEYRRLFFLQNENTLRYLQMLGVTVVLLRLKGCKK